MYAMQYRIALPNDYDMGVIRERVAKAAPLLDDRPGLGFKTYLVRERGVAGALSNQYAPFYLWRDTASMGDFLWGGEWFGPRIVGSFGRPPVHHWTVVAYDRGPAYGSVPVSATLHSEQLPAETDPADGVAAALNQPQDGSVHSTTVAVDPYRWELIRFTLWARPASGPEAYQVLHVSAPEEAAL
jgi:hypothetical protein